MQEILIPLSKKKTSIIFLGTCCFVFVCLWLINIAEIQTRFSPLLVKTISFIGIIFFSICGIYIFIKFFNKKSGLVINEEGIFDNSSAIGVGLVKWQNITNVKVIEIYKQKILIIGVNNANEIIARQTGMKRRLMDLNNKSYGSPVQITSNALVCNFKELFNIIKEQLSAHRLE
ncbi:MAG: STM3941 family protein [Candidatus Magasanikbacteria bacterium]|jgi:hypothetical protein